MESSEDDAGTATSASRRTSAREKDVGQAEDVDATSSYHQDINEGRTSCQTPAMSEDNFDGDSVPSPSAQDVNTSTEAILDMIDEIVDGPGAPKRLPLSTLINDNVKELVIAVDDSNNTQDSVKLDCADDLPQAHTLPESEDAKSEILDTPASSAQVKVSSPCETLPDVNIVASAKSSHDSVSVPDSEETVVSATPEPTSAVLVEPETSVACPSLPSSSVLQNEPEVCDSEIQERTLESKSVSSSDNRDSVTIEKAESTSSECNVSDTRPPDEGNVVKSPLKRRLIRPPPCDRRPDSTVSSTVDSQTFDVFSNIQSSETVTKDVSSSSDAMPIVHGNNKTEEIRNISDVSICKAEASVSPPKKIKLIRQKITPPTQTEDSGTDDHQVHSIIEQCQSTSPDVHVSTVTDLQEQSSCMDISTSEQQESLETSALAAKLPPTIQELSMESCKDQDQQDKECIKQPSQENKDYRPNSPKINIATEDNSSQIIEEVKSPIEPLHDSKLQVPIDNDISDEKCLITEKQEDAIISEDVNKTETLIDITPTPTIIEKIESYKETTKISPNVNIDSEQSITITPSDVTEESLKEISDKVLVKQEDITINDHEEDNKKVPPIKLNLTAFPEASTSQVVKDGEHLSINKNESESVKQIPKLTIRLSNKQSDEIKSPIPKLTIKPIIRPPTEDVEISKDNSQQIKPITKLNIKPIPKPTTDLSELSSTPMDGDDKNENKEQIPCITKINIKPISRPSDAANDIPTRLHPEVGRENNRESVTENIPCITKLNIKPILKPPEKINDIHRKSSSSEISESECSENDESTSTSDQASTSDQGTSDIVPKVTIKLGKPGTESEGKFYTEQNIPKLTIKGLQNCGNEEEDTTSKLKLIINQPDDAQTEKIPKITIKTVSKLDNQPLSPKLTIKPLKPPDSIIKENEVTKHKSTDSFSGSPEIKENIHVPKITIKPIIRTEADTASKTPKKSTALSDGADHIPIITKLNIKPILKPTGSEDIDNVDEKVPVVSKLNIKPVVKPKDNELDSSIEDVPKITKLNIKPLRNPEVNSSEPKDCDADTDENSIPVVTKINIKPIIKPVEEDVSKDSENQSSETGNSSDDNADIPVVTKLNIKPILKPIESEEIPKSSISNEQVIPSIAKLNIKLAKPDETSTSSSPKKEHLKSPEFRSSTIPVVTKLNIKPVIKPEEKEQLKIKDENEEKSLKNPPLVMKINMKAVVENVQAPDNEVSSHSEHICNNLNEHTNDIIEPTSVLKTSGRHSETDKSQKTILSDVQQSCVESKANSVHDHTVLDKLESKFCENSSKPNCVTDNPNVSNFGATVSTLKRPNELTSVLDSKEDKPNLEEKSSGQVDSKTDASVINTHSDSSLDKTKINQASENNETRGLNQSEIPALNKSPFLQNCKLLKKLLENSRDQLVIKVEEPKNMTNCTIITEKKDSKMTLQKDVVNCSTSLGCTQESQQSADHSLKNISTESSFDPDKSKTTSTDKVNDTSHSTLSFDMSKPLEISISEKYSGQSSGQDSPRIILKINKTDHGPSAKIITEDVKRTDSFQQKYAEYTQETLSDRESPRKHIVNSRRKMNPDDSVSLTVGKRLRSSRIVENTDKSPTVKRNVGKRPSTTEVSPVQNKEPDLSVLETKRLKLGQLLSGNKSLTITPVVRATQLSPSKLGLDNKQVAKVPNHTILNNENCSKNGNSKLHNILSNLQAKQKQSLNMNATVTDKNQSPESGSEVKSNVAPIENCHVQVQEMIINENCDLRDHAPRSEEVLRDPLEVSMPKAPCDTISDKIIVPRIEELTPQPKKRGRPRKLPVSEGAKPATVTLPVPALEERPQRSLRLTRDRPAILTKPRGRGRGRGRRVDVTTPPPPPPDPLSVTIEQTEERVLRTIDPTSSRIKLPRMTEALDKMPGGCSTPLLSRRRPSSGVFSEGELKVVLETTVPKLEEAFIKSPEIVGRGRGGRGSRGGRGRTPRGRGRGRGGGRGAVYMKETMGIYGRVCGPATTTVQLFEEETCMMDDNATPAKPSHLLDEDSQSSVKSSTNESSKTKKSKFSDLFDSNKVWTAADVKEYTWSTRESAEASSQVMMIQEQVAMFLGVKSFKRRYPELKRRPIVGEEKDFVLAKELVTEALCDLGITAVDASEVLDIMLSDYPHKYEEYRSHQRERQLTGPPPGPPDPPVELKQEEKPVKMDVKPEKPVEQKPELPKIDPEKTRQDMAAAAIASASEWNARVNAWRRPACVDLQSLCVHRRRAPVPRAPAPAPTHLRPPAGFYPHALLPGQYQHWYRTYTPEQLRYFPLNTVVSAPPAPPSPADSSSDSEQEWGSRTCSSDDSDSRTQPAKRKKLTKVKRSSQAESKEKEKEEPEPSVEDLCRVCKLRLEGNRKYTHERFLVCASCQAKLHPSCVDLSADTIRKCREYAWQCAECKTCCSCRLPADDDKMLFCDLCDRGFHIYCVGLDAVPTGRWHCVECAVCKSCGAREPAGLPADPAAPSPSAPAPAGPAQPAWHHQTRRGPGGHKVYSHSLCTPCARVR